jgi:hypothetical protein
MANDFSWVKPAGEGIANMFGLNPEDRARGAMIQAQQQTEGLRAKKIEGEIGLIPAREEEIRSRIGKNKAGEGLTKTKDTEAQSKIKSQERLAVVLSRAFNPDGTIKPEMLPEIVREFPNINVNLEQFGKGIGQMALQAKSSGVSFPPAARPSSAPSEVQQPLGEITQSPQPGASLPQMIASPMDLAPGVTTVDDELRNNNFRGLMDSVDPRAGQTGVVQPPQGVSEILAIPEALSRQAQDEDMRMKLLRTGNAAAAKDDFVASAAGASAQKDRTLADKIALANAEPFTLGQGQQRINAQGQVVGENGIPLEVSEGASLMTKGGAVVGTAPKAPGSGRSGKSGSGAGAAGEEGSATTLDVNRSNEWISRAKEVVAEWAGATSGNPIDPGTAGQLAAHAYRQYFGQGMPTRNADEVMREYLQQSGFKFDNTVGNWNPFNSNKTEVTTKDGKVVTGGADSPLPQITPGATGNPAGAAKSSGRMANGKDLIPSPDGSTPDNPHALGVGLFPSDPTDSSIKPGMFFRARSAYDDKYYVFQRQPDGTNLIVDDATTFAAVDGRLSELQSAGFTVFGSDMPKDMRFKEQNGSEKVYKQFEPVNVRHLLAPSTGLAGGVKNWGWVNKVGTFSPLNNMLRYIARSETGMDNYQGMRVSPTVKAYYAETDPDKRMDMLQKWLNNRVAPVQEWHQKELEARTAKPATVASTLSDTK